MTMWALFPRILRLRSWLKPPITLTTLDSAHELIATPQIDRTLITVRKPLFWLRTCLVATKETKVRPSMRSITRGNRANKTMTTNRVAPRRWTADRIESLFEKTCVEGEVNGLLL